VALFGQEESIFLDFVRTSLIDGLLRIAKIRKFLHKEHLFKGHSFNNVEKSNYSKLCKQKKTKKQK